MLSVGDAGALVVGSVPVESVGDGEPEAGSVGVGESVGSSATKAAFSREVPVVVPSALFFASAEVTPGSTRLTSSPLGSGELEVPSAATTRASTPSLGPTHSGSEAPRASLAPGSALSAGCGSRSRFCQPVHSLVARSRVRTWAVPSSSVFAPVQETPSSENCSVLVRSTSRRPSRRSSS